MRRLNALRVIGGASASTLLAGCGQSLLSATENESNATDALSGLPPGTRVTDIFAHSNATIRFLQPRLNKDTNKSVLSSGNAKALSSVYVVSPAVISRNPNGVAKQAYNLVLTFSDKSSTKAFVDPDGSTLYCQINGVNYGVWSSGIVKGNDGNAWVSSVKFKNVNIGSVDLALMRNEKQTEARDRPLVDTCAVAAGALALGALKVLSVVGSAAVADAGAAAGATVGAVIGAPLGPVGSTIGAVFGESVGASAAETTFQAVINNPATSQLVLGLAFDVMCDKLTTPPGPSTDGGNADYDQSSWADPAAETAAVGTLGNDGSWQTSIQIPD